MKNFPILMLAMAFCLFNQQAEAQDKATQQSSWDHLDIGKTKLMDGFIRIEPESPLQKSILQTKESFTGPIEIVVVARTEHDNIRLHAFNGACVIFNWEVNRAELRVHRPDGNERQASGSIATAAVRPLDANTWYTLRWRVTKEGMEVFVNGKSVFSEKRNYNLWEKCPMMVRSWKRSIVDVKAFAVTHKAMAEVAQNQTSQVVAEGLGGTSDESLKDAFRNAVRQVVGAVVDAETLVKNDQIISDKVLTYSDGFVKSYDEISKTQDKGVYRTKIKASVERRSVIAKLKASNIAVKDIDGKGIFAEIVTQLDAEKNAKELMEKTLEGFPLNVLKVEVVGKPEIVRKDDARATIRLRVKFSVDLDAYKSFSQKCQEVLDKIAKEKGDLQIVGKDEIQRWRNAGVYRPFDIAYMPTKNNFGNMVWEVLVPDAFRGNRPAVALCLTNTEAMDRMEWRYYIVDRSILDLLASRSSNAWLNHERNKHSCELKLHGADGKTVATARFDSSPDPSYGLSTNLIRQPTRHGEFHTIGPVFLITQSGTGYTPHFFVMREISLTLEELKAVQRIECKIH